MGRDLAGNAQRRPRRHPIKGLPNGQRYSDAAAAKGRAAWPVVAKHCPTKTKAQCREIIRTWVNNGVLYNADYEDPVQWKDRPGLFVDSSKRPSM